MAKNRDFRQVKQQKKMLSFYKIFQSADLSSESLRAIPYNFMRSVSENDFSNKMEINAVWGSSWPIEIDQNPRFYYIEKRGWDKFVIDNVLGENEFVSFTLTGNCLNVNIFEQNGKEILTPRRSYTTPFPPSSKRVKTEHDESFFKDVKKEEETGESSGVRKKKAQDIKTSKKKTKSKCKRVKVEDHTIPEFSITIKKSYLRFLAVPKQFSENHISGESMVFKIVHPKGDCSWKVLCLVRKTGTTFSSGWSKMAREFPLTIGDNCTLKLIKPNKLLLIVNPDEEITMVD